MIKQVFNPFLPLDEYVPDGEAHVFGDRVYLYGSHDSADAERFCIQDYTIWSASVNDLREWVCHGVTYKKSQDLRAQGVPPEKHPDYYAPDCVRGNDGRYYLYYVAMGPNVRPFGPMSVAVSDSPSGPFEYLGDIRNKDGSPLMAFLTNDPTVINDDGRIYLYYGWGLGRDFSNKAFSPLFNFVLSKLTKRSTKAIKNTKPSILSCAFAELEEDMLTVKAPPKAILDCKTTAKKGTQLYDHPFYEAPSIRKFGDLYYLIYSSGENNELAYATSEHPDRGFNFRGVIISNSDIGFEGNDKPKNVSGTIHGSIEKINDKYYIFYHRCTNNTDFSRQACCEEIEIAKDGTIKQVEVTSCGLNGNPLEGKGSYPASICCNLYGENMKTIGLKNHDKHCRITQENSEQYICDIENGTVIGYKYFDFRGKTKFGIIISGKAEGKLEIMTDSKKEPIGEIKIMPCGKKNILSSEIVFTTGKSALYLRFKGKGKFNLYEIIFE